jgi:aspartyl aminopeptidase
MPGADLGVPMLAMHSAREMAAGNDYVELVKLMTAFFASEK